MTTSPTQYLSALSLSSPAPSLPAPPPQPPTKTPSYRSLLKSHRRLESTIAALQSQLNEEKRSAAWWKNRVCDLDTRCRSIDVDLARVTKEKHTLERTITKLQQREKQYFRIVQESPGYPPRTIEATTQTEVEGGDESQKDLVIKALIQMVWNKQAESALLSSGAAGCECDAAKALRSLFPESPPLGASSAAPEEEGVEDPLKEMIRRRGRRLGKGKATDTSEGSGRVPVVETPPHPHPEVFSRARKERKAALKMKLIATREMVDGLKRENGVLEELLGEGSEGGSNRGGERYGARFGYG